jgi:hypothetical protein
VSLQQPLALPSGKVNDPSLVLSAKQVAIDAALDVVLEFWYGIEAEIEQSFTVAISDGGWQQVSDKIETSAMLGAISSKAERYPKGSQLCSGTVFPSD